MKFLPNSTILPITRIGLSTDVQISLYQSSKWWSEYICLAISCLNLLLRGILFEVSLLFYLPSWSISALQHIREITIIVTWHARVADEPHWGCTFWGEKSNVENWKSKREKVRWGHTCQCPIVWLTPPAMSSPGSDRLVLPKISNFSSPFPRRRRHQRWIICTCRHRVFFVHWKS